MEIEYLNDEHYKVLDKIYNIIKNKDHCNLLLYSRNNVESIKNKFLKVLQFIEPSNKQNKINGEFIYESSEIYYSINCKLNKPEIMIDFIKEITNTFNYYTCNKHYIILENTQLLNIKTTEKLKKIIENSFQTSKFILISDKYTHSLSSYLLTIVFPSLSKYDKKIYNHCNFKLKPINEIIKKIFDVYENNFTIKNIRDISYKIKELAIPTTEFLIIFMNEIINVYNVNIYEIVHLITLYDTLFLNSFRDIIYYE